MKRNFSLARWLQSRPKPKVEVGQRFQECDKRLYRIVEVVKIEGERVHIKTVVNDGLTYNSGVVVPLPIGKITIARKNRFYRNSNGYRRLYGSCHDCRLAAGGVVPPDGHMGITVTMGTCSECLNRDATLVPYCDYHWPKEGRKAVFD